MPRKLVSIFIAAVLLLTAVSAVYGHTYDGTVTITCTDFTAAGTGADTLDRDNTGLSEENLRIDVLDGVGTTLYTLSFSNTLGTYAAGLINTTPYVTAPQANPIIVKVTSLAGNGLPEVVQVIGSGECAGLPSAGGGLPIPVTAVMGNLPVATQAFFAPGQAAAGVVLNAGTYWVLGTDSSGDYYKIILANQYLWVPVGSMQPSFEAPAQGQPLPTIIVN